MWIPTITYFSNVISGGDVWMAAQNEVKWRSCTSWEGIVADLGNVHRRPKKFIQRIAIAAKVYFIWREESQAVFATNADGGTDCKGGDGYCMA